MCQLQPTAVNSIPKNTIFSFLFQKKKKPKTIIYINFIYFI